MEFYPYIYVVPRKELGTSMTNAVYLVSGPSQAIFELSVEGLVAAEDFIFHKLMDHGDKERSDFHVNIWAIHDRWPPDERNPSEDVRESLNSR